MKDRQSGSPWLYVAVPAAVALGAIGTVAASRAGLPPLLGTAAGVVAALLAILALPSLPTRRATILLLGMGGLAALRHAAFPGSDSSVLLLLWAVGTLLALLFADRADAESTPALAGGTPLAGRVGESMRVAIVLAVVVSVAAVLLVPTVTDRLGRRVWSGLTPNPSARFSAEPSLRSSRSLDMTTRPRLSDKVVFTVDAARANFWRGETFDTWDGSTWTRSSGADDYVPLERNGDTTQLRLDPYDDGARSGVETRQTFRIEADFSDVLFAAPSPVSVQTDKLLAGRSDGTAVVAPFSPDGRDGFGHGAVYTVTSRSVLPTADDLRAASNRPMPQGLTPRYTQLPASTTARVLDLGRRVTANATTTYDKIIAIEAWLGEHTRYSVNAPLSPKGVDVVDDFLFHTRVGWCEQVASSMVVLARSAGIPARLVTGFVPGERDHLTGRFVVRERDAHAWAEIYFPGIGWQGFDPTASVPLAGDAHSGGSWLDTARHHAVLFGFILLTIALLAATAPELLETARRRRARRRAPWAAKTLARVERIGGRAGRPRAPAETPREYAHALAAALDEPRLDHVGDALDVAAYSARGVDERSRDATEAVLTSLEP